MTVKELPIRPLLFPANSKFIYGSMDAIVQAYSVSVGYHIYVNDTSLYVVSMVIC